MISFFFGYCIKQKMRHPSTRTCLLMASQCDPVKERFIGFVARVRLCAVVEQEPRDIVVANVHLCGRKSDFNSGVDLHQSVKSVVITTAEKV